tara:strand:+ start:831 stop:1082 length:252 start_codon:yes stop_codon:yes gene_type:complete
MLKVQCRSCGKELIGHETQTRTCGCSNMTTIRGDNVSANDLSMVTMLRSDKNPKKKPLLSSDDLKYQEARRQRKVRKITFEER